MNKIKQKFLPYMLIALCILIIGGTVNIVRASSLSDDIFDRVADKIAEKLLSELDTQADVEDDGEAMLGISSKDELWLDNDSGVIYLGTGKTAGVRISSGVLQSKNVGGTWGALGATTPGDEGWIAYEPIMTPATNEDGYRYVAILGGSNIATSSITNADATTVLVADGGFVTTGTADFNGVVEMDSTLTVDGASTLTGNVAAGGTLAVTGNTTLSGTLTQTGVATFNADPIIGGTTPTLTIGDGGAENAALVYNGVQDFYIGVYDTDDDLVIGAGSTIGTTPAISIADDLSIVIDGTLNSTAAVDFDTTLNVDGAMTVAAITGDGNWLTTGNLSGANVTASGNLTAGGSLYVINSGDNVGIATSTPNWRLSVVDTSAQLALGYDGNGQVTFGVDTGDDLTIVPSGGDVDITGTLTVSSTLTIDGTSTFQGPLIASEGVTSTVGDVALTDGRLVLGTETGGTCSSGLAINLSTVAKGVITTVGETNTACDVSFTNGAAGEVVFLSHTYNGTGIVTFADVVGFDATWTPIASNCTGLDGGVTAATGDSFYIVGVMTSATEIMITGCQYFDA